MDSCWLGFFVVLLHQPIKRPKLQFKQDPNLFNQAIDISFNHTYYRHKIRNNYRNPMCMHNTKKAPLCKITVNIIKAN